MSVSQSSIVIVYDLPDDTVGGGELCQELAEIQDNTNYFLWDGVAFTCTLFTTFDIDNCPLVAGLATPDLYDCLPEAGSHTCNDFSEVKLG